MRKNNIAGSLAVLLMNAAFAQTVTSANDVKPATPTLSTTPVTTVSGAKIAPIGGSVTPGSERTLMDLGALEREVEFNKRLDAIAKSKGQSGAQGTPAAAPVVAPVQPIVVKPVVKPKPVPVVKTFNPDIRLKAIYGVGNNLVATFALPGNQMVERKLGQEIDGWKIQGFALGGLTATSKKHTTFVRLDTPTVSSIPTQAGVPILNAPQGGNAVSNAVLPSPNLNSGQFVTPVTR